MAAEERPSINIALDIYGYTRGNDEPPDPVFIQQDGSFFLQQDGISRFEQNI